MVKKAAGNCVRAGVRAALVLFVLPLLYLLEPIYRIRLGTMHTQRFGQLAANADTFLRTLQLEGAPSRTFYLLFGWNPANRQLMEMWKRTRGFPVRFVESYLGTWLMIAWRPILVKTRFWEPTTVTATEYYLYNHTEPVLSFTEDEEKKGRALLADMGIGDDDWFVCFNARDGAYFRDWRPELEDYWQMIDFRNVDIGKFLSAAEYVASRGGFAVRYGAGVENPLPETGNPRIIDYATKCRSDFMDIYLAAKCRFFIGTCSGPIGIASAFNVPVLSVSHFPFNYAYYRRCDIFIPRLLVTPESGRRVPFGEAKQAGYYVGWEMASSIDKNMHLFDMLAVDPDDILDGCKDMLESLEGRAPPAPAREIQDVYADQYLSDYAGYEFAAQIGPRFVIKYRDLIVPEDGGGLTE